MGNKTNTSTSESTSKNESWLLPHLQDAILGAFGNAGNLPELEWADMTPEQKQALDKIMQGQDWGQMGQGAGWLGQTGMGSAQAGLDAWKQNQDRLNQLYGEGGILTEQGYQDAINSMYNSDLVNQQLEVAGKGIEDMLGKSVQGINQRAVAGGGMGSSRAGVAEGVATGKAADAMANATAQIQSNAYAQAIQGANQQAGNIMSGINMGMQSGSNMFGQGGNMMNQGMGWGSNIMQGQMQDQFNKFGAGSIYQQWNQGKADRDYWNKLQGATGGLSTLLPILGSTAGWGGTSTTTGTTTQKQGSGNFWGGLAGSAIGGAMGGFGSGMGNALGGMLFSDERLKKNVKKAEKKDGIQYYDWEWNAKAKEIGADDQPTHGVIAQEVKKKRPKAVKKQKNGFLKVDYSKL